MAVNISSFTPHSTHRPKITETLCQPASHGEIPISSWTPCETSTPHSLCAENGTNLLKSKNLKVHVKRDFWFSVCRALCIFLFSRSTFSEESARSCTIPVNADSWFDPWAAMSLGAGSWRRRRTGLERGHGLTALSQCCLLVF